MRIHRERDCTKKEIVNWFIFAGEFPICKICPHDQSAAGCMESLFVWCLVSYEINAKLFLPKYSIYIYIKVLDVFLINHIK